MSILTLSAYKYNPALGNLYALVFGPDGKAWKFSGGVYAFATYTSGAHNQFAIAMTENSQRTKFWSVDLNSSIFTLPHTTDFQQYSVEIWAEHTPGTQSRSADTLVTDYKFAWTPSRDRFEVYVNASYDSHNNTLGYVAWLEENGELVLTATTVQIIVHDSSDVEVYNHTASVIGSLGQFNMFQANITLSPDQAYFATGLIIDADGIVHKSGACFLTWD